MIPANHSALASQCLTDQIDDRDGTCVSLSALWRAVGSPAGRDPASWLSIAAPLIEGIRAYLANLDATIDPLDLESLIGDIEPCEIWSNDHEEGETLQAGDVMSTYLIARHYAEHLDARAGLDLSTLSYPTIKGAIDAWRAERKPDQPAETETR